MSLPRVAKKASVRETVKSALRSAVISGDLRPGEVYSAPVLAEQLGVSATPVREAMLDLVREGMVVALPNRGFLVTDVSAQDLDDITEIRLMLEPPAVANAVPSIPAQALPALRASAQRIVDQAADGNLVEYLTADSDFHLALLRYAGNARLVDLVATLRSQTRLFGLSELAESGALVASAQEHHAILDAVEARDADLARELMHRHIEHVRAEWAGATPPEPAAQAALHGQGPP